MSVITISNPKLTVRIATKGAELQSIKSNSGVEYLWQGDERYWKSRALNIFPYIARLTQGKYLYQGKEYQLPIHGFVPYMELDIEELEEQYAVFKLTSTDYTKKQYPFEFEYRVKYELEYNHLKISYQVTNKDKKTMYFGLGGHPGFNVPIEPELNFEDYYLEFEKECRPIRIGFSDDCFVNGKEEPFSLEEGRILRLNHNLFDHDAIVLNDMDSCITLQSDSGRVGVKVEYSGMRYLGLWHKPQTNAPYICIEPWSSLPSRKDIVEDIETQEDLLRLKNGHTLDIAWGMTFYEK